VMPDRSPAYHGRGGTVGGGGNCAVDTEVSKQSDVGRNETMIGSSKVVVGHMPNNVPTRSISSNFLVLTARSRIYR